MWCVEEDVHIDFLGWAPVKKKVPKRMRCEKCKKNIRVFIRECHDAGCMHLYMSKHKVKDKVKKQKTRHERHCR